MTRLVQATAARPQTIFRIKYDFFRINTIFIRFLYDFSSATSRWERAHPAREKRRTNRLAKQPEGGFQTASNQ